MRQGIERLSDGHILLIRLCNWVGEVVLALPAIRRLENAGFQVHLFGKGWAPALLEGTHLPVTVRRPSVMKAISQLRTLRRDAFGSFNQPQALLFTRSFSSALEAKAAGFRTFGYSYDGRKYLLEEAYERPSGMHAGHEYWHLVNLFLGEEAPFPEDLGLRPSRTQLESAAELLSMHGLSAGKYVVLCPFSGADDREDRKVWPGFSALTEQLRRLGYATVVLSLIHI